MFIKQQEHDKQAQAVVFLRPIPCVLQSAISSHCVLLVYEVSQSS